MKIANVLDGLRLLWIAPVLMLTACLPPRDRTIPDWSIAHRVSKDATVSVIVDNGEKVTEAEVFLEAGEWWVISDRALEAAKE